MPVVIGKLGVMLLLLALAHGATLVVLSRVREEQVGEEVTRSHADARAAGYQSNPGYPSPAPGYGEATVTPAEGQAYAEPDVHEPVPG